jgi:predicted Zn-dependent protease
MNKIIRQTLLPCLVVLLGISCASAAGSRGPQPTDDPILHALQSEMARSRSALHLENSSAPYFIAYHVTDIDSWEADAALGGIRSEMRSHVRYLTVQVRLGDYKQDSSSAHGDGSVEVLPLDSDEHAIRFQVWSATDKAYKQAVAALTAKQARLKQLTIDHPVDDFAHAEPVESIQPIVALQVEREPWIKMLREASGIYARDPKVQYLEAALNFKAVNRYYVNSEGTVVRGGEEHYRLNLGGDTQADDGMQLSRDAEFAAETPKDLPSAHDFQQHAEEIMASLKQLREAPLADEDYHGPVLMSAESASAVFSSLVGENILGFKPELGQNARVHGQFASSYKTRVLPEFLSVVDDPTLTQADGTSLMGHYTVDDEGVLAQRVPVIENGVLVSYLLGRQPIRDFPASNGHGRTSLPVSWPMPSLGNLVVSSSQPVSPDQLKQKLIELCKERGLDYGYQARSMGDAHGPRLLYRVWVKDGREELVRGALFGDLDQRSMRSNIVAAGNDAYVDNELMPVAHSVVTPSILFDDLEVKRQTSDKDKLPEYPSPAMASK